MTLALGSCGPALPDPAQVYTNTTQTTQAGSEWRGNYYEPTSPAQYTDPREAGKGFKNLYAMKVWHGSPGILLAGDDGCGQTGQDIPETPTLQTKYLRRRVVVTAHSDYNSGGNPATWWDIDSEVIRDASVDKLTGVLTVNECSDTNTVDSSEGASTPNVLLACKNFGEVALGCGSQSLQTAPSTYGFVASWPQNSTLAALETALSDGNYGTEGGPGDWGTKTVSLSVTRTAFTLTYARAESYGGAVAHETLSIQITFSDTYTAEELKAHVFGLLTAGYWDLTDDGQIPWRDDTDCANGPCLAYNERTTAANPTELSCFQDCPYTPDTPTLRQSWIAAGTVIGIPTPTGYAQYIDLDKGVSNPYYTHASYWTDSASMPQPAFISYNKHETNALVVGIWMELIDTHFPAHNWFRPCGVDSTYVDAEDNPYWPDAWKICGDIGLTDATNASPIVVTLESAASYLDTGDRVTISGVAGNAAANGSWTVTRIDDTHFSLDGSSGNGAYTSGGRMKDEGAPDPSWNTDASQGHFCVITPVWDFRAHARDSTGYTNTTAGLRDIHCETKRAACSACGPAIVTVGLAPVRGVFIPLPFSSMVIDELYGNLVQVFVKRTMIDPLNIPILPVLLEECRCSPPVGAPALPAGASVMGCEGYVEAKNADPIEAYNAECENTNGGCREYYLEAP